MVISFSHLKDEKKDLDEPVTLQFVNLKVRLFGYHDTVNFYTFQDSLEVRLIDYHDVFYSRIE